MRPRHVAAVGLVVAVGLLLAVTLPRLGTDAALSSSAPVGLPTPRLQLRTEPAASAVAAAEGVDEDFCAAARGPLLGACSAANRVDCCHSRSRFLFFGNSFGRHHNQMSSFAAAAALARRTNRTLIVPPFVEAKRPALLQQLYNATWLLDPRNGLCLLTSEEFISKEASDALTNATCITMRGIGVHPQKVPGLRLACTESVAIRYKKKLDLFTARVVEDPAVAAARLVTIPLAIYYAEALPLAEVACVWRGLEPHPVVVRALAELQACARSRADAAVGVHLRSLEGSCAARAREFVPSRNEAKLRVIVAQCEMQPGAVRAAVAPSLKSFAAIVADDGQQPRHAGDLAKALGGFRLRELGDVCPAASEALQADAAAAAATTPASMGYWAMTLDFWALATSSMFFGNQLSTLSMNVCRRRLATGRRCDNFFEFGLPQAPR